MFQTYTKIQMPGFGLHLQDEKAIDGVPISHVNVLRSKVLELMLGLEAASEWVIEKLHLSLHACLCRC